MTHMQIAAITLRPGEETCVPVAEIPLKNVNKPASHRKQNQGKNVVESYQ